MRIIRNYILRDFFSTFIFSLLLLSMVMLLGNLVKVSDMVMRKGVNLIDAAGILWLFIPYLLGFTIPLSFLLGILLSLGRLMADNELTAINVAGTSAWRLTLPLFCLGLILSGVLFILNDRTIPEYHYRSRKAMKSIYSKNLTAFIEPGTFCENFPNHIIYTSDVDGNALKNVFIYELSENEQPSKVTYAETAQFVTEDNVLRLKLNNGFRDQNDPQKQTMARLNFKTFFMDIPLPGNESATAEKKPSDMPLKELSHTIRLLKHAGANPQPLEIEYFKRISFSFSTVTFVLLGFGTALTVKHREKTVNFGLALACAGIYYLLFMLGAALVERKYLSVAAGMWLPNVIVAAIGLWLMLKRR
jgi:LPS export ABC transporter permease LptF